MDTSTSSASLCDVSFAGSTITVAGVKITQFMDDANPVDFPDVEVSSVGINCNGKMIRYAKPAPIMMSVTVIPGSSDDKQLWSKWRSYHLEDAKNNQGTWTQSLTANISIGNTNAGQKTYAFSGGTFVSGPAGPSSSGDGKMQGRTYTFAFAKVNQ